MDDIADLQRQQTDDLVTALRAIADPLERDRQVRKALDRIRDQEGQVAEVRRDALRELLHTTGVSQAELARRLNLKAPTLNALVGPGRYPGRYKRAENDQSARQDQKEHQRDDDHSSPVTAAEPGAAGGR